MPMLPSSTNPLLLPVFGCSIYGLYLSYKNITRLQRYESQTKTAAEWSETVAEQLRTTQTTQGAAAVTVCFHLIPYPAPMPSTTHE
ncbi:hypothetical protein GQ43DRAFT_440251 [Delitschia confertaspora ATCC 74209]|uniref:Uncharacterized protein n=1 Tax=Delitschia confertaspora ATCC 74209 TaxID=1513339 RepID=A0A9P4JLY0_9PLEO|nr:hypothetical protein GQ43DRAFT_440251 [Delitschia confertaspora ATCC 74209]